MFTVHENFNCEPFISVVEIMNGKPKLDKIDFVRLERWNEKKIVIN